MEQDLIAGWQRSGTLACVVTFSLADRRGRDLICLLSALGALLLAFASALTGCSNRRIDIAHPLEYRVMSAAGTVAEPLARLTRRADITRNLAIPRTTGMPHRPTSSDGHTSIFVSSNPIGLRYRLSKCARRCACLSLPIGGFGSAAVPIVPHRRRTVWHGFYRIWNNTGSRYRGGMPHYLVPCLLNRIMMVMTPSSTASPPEGANLPRSNPTKQRILGLLAEFFCLRTNDAAELLRNRAITESDARSVRRTLSVLHRDGFLYRAPHFDSGHDRGGAGYVYGLSAKGVGHALRNGYSTSATKTLDEHSVRTLDHELELTAFHIALHRLCSATGLRHRWRQKDLKHTVHPDAVFNVVDPANPGKAFCYFLEIERSKLGNYRNGEPQILRKLQRYYEYFNSTCCEKEWGFRQYRVIVVQRSDARREGLLTALREKYNHRMFWLTTETAYRENIDGAIFETPKDDAPAAFTFLTR